MANDDRFTKLADLVLRARALATDERETFLRNACADDSELYAEALRLSQVPTDAAGRLEEFDPFDSLVEPPRLEPGAVFDRYRVVRQLARGGMSTVYLGTHLHDQHPAAIKFLNPTGLRFSRNENELLAKLNYDYIARLFDSDITDEGVPYLILEYVDGPDFAGYCESHDLSLDERLKLFLLVCKGVQYAHSAPIAHRDLKPGNILVTKEGVPKLLDFGIARQLPAGARDAALTHAENQPKTLHFASPEQILGQRTGIPSDIYSLGVILCVLATGHLPYRVRTMGALYSAIPTQEPTRPSELLDAPRRENPADELHYPYVGPELPSDDRRRLKRRLESDLDFIVLKALRKEPEKRYQTVAELAADVERFLNDEPVSARKGSTRYVIWKYCQKHTGQVIGYGVAVLAIIGLLIGLFVSLLESSRQREFAEQQAQRAQEVTDFLISTFEIPDPSRSRGETITAREILDQGTQRIRQQLANQPRTQAALLSTMGGVYRSLGLYAEALKLLQDALTIREQVLPAGHSEIAENFEDVGEVLFFTGDLEAAAKSFHRAIELKRANLGPDSPLLANSIDSLGVVYTDMDRIDQAEALHREALAIRRKTLPPDHSDITDSLNNLAYILEDQGKIDEADALYRESLQIRRKVLGNPHPLLALSLSNLGMLLHTKGELKEAAVLNQEALAMRRRLFGNRHPDVAQNLSNLAFIFQDLGDLNTAENMLRESLSISGEFLEPNHPDIATQMQNLASVLADKGELAEAEDIYRQALAIRRASLGDSHPRVAQTLTHLARILNRKAMYKAAEPLAIEAQNICLAATSKNELCRAIARIEIATCLTAFKDYGSAERLLLSSINDLQNWPDRPARLRGLQRAFQQSVFLYERWSKPEKAAEYRKLLAQVAPKAEAP